MKKICYITTISGTLKAFVLPTTKYISDKTDWEITMMCNPDDTFIENLPDNIKFIPMPMKRGISLSGVGTMFKMIKVFKKEKFDLIQYSTPNASLYAALAGFFARVPVRLYCQWGMAFVGFSGFKRKIFKFIEKTVCRLSTWIEPDSKSNLEFSHKEGLYPENKGSVIWNGSASGVNLEKFDYSRKEEYRTKIRREMEIPDDAFVYIFVGRITKDKGINELYRAFKTVIEDKEDAYLMMVGSEELDSTVDKQLYNWSRNNEKVIYAGYTNFVEQFLSAADCYVLPSYREGFGMSVVEAEAMGVPVIITEIPGPIDAMQRNETGLVVKKANSEELCSAMNSLYSDREKCRKFGLQGEKLAREKFEQKKFVDFVIEDRKKLLGE